MTALRGSCLYDGVQFEISGLNAISIAIAGAGRRREFLTSRQRRACLLDFPAWGPVCALVCPVR